ncbi:hypothetical protein [Gelidibacter maritimus]|uniref:Uncharacterized protein n=1 Tax=Gelidibacter maritimus TaxID=2761487 RepID=A0A7W2M7T3_9FLAO|nr:hypothetical protein [Gelidibacter maritimus]MBA6154275.1 hypothetical protein [Gelidibacter maritimus]
MIKGLYRYTDTISFNYLNDFFNSIQKNIISAAKNNNQEAFEKLLNFYLLNFLTKTFGKSENLYSKGASTLVNIYDGLNTKFKPRFVERVFESLTAKISFSNDLEDFPEKYIELSYLCLINITKKILQEDNYDLFNKAFTDIDKSLTGLDSIKNREGYLFKFITTLLCWIYFLRSQNSISYEKFNFQFLENTFQDLTVDLDRNFLNDFFDLFEEIEKGLWTAENWEIKEPPPNEAYFALSSRTWLTFSLVIILFKYDNLIRSNDDLKKIKLRDRFRYFNDDIRKNLDEISEEKNEFIDLIFSPNLKPEEIKRKFDYKKEQILEVFTFLRKEVEIEHYKKIKDLPLSLDKIEDFRYKVGKNWEDGTVIIAILKLFNKVKYLPNIKERDGYGFFQTLLKGKFAFIDGEHYQEIYGLSDFGSRLARDIDNQFFKNILEYRFPTKSENINVSIDKFLDGLKNTNRVVIFANWKNEQKLNSTIYTEEKVLLNSYKSYRGVPILNSFNSYKDYIFIIDFSNIKIKLYTNESSLWYKDQLLVDITEYSKENLTDENIQKWRESDKFDYNAEEVDILESNNINIKVLLKFDFIINDNLKALILDCS